MTTRKPNFNCSAPGLDDKCFDFLNVEGYNPCIKYQGSRISLFSTIALFVFLVLLCLQSIRTAKSIISRLPKCEMTPARRLLRCARKNSDVRICLMAGFASAFFFVSSCTGLTTV